MRLNCIGRRMTDNNANILLDVGRADAAIRAAHRLPEAAKPRLVLFEIVEWNSKNAARSSAVILDLKRMWTGLNH
jgi:hypothetical protein